MQQFLKYPAEQNEDSVGFGTHYMTKDNYIYGLPIKTDNNF